MFILKVILLFDCAFKLVYSTMLFVNFILLCFPYQVSCFWLFNYCQTLNFSLNLGLFLLIVVRHLHFQIVIHVFFLSLYVHLSFSLWLSVLRFQETEFVSVSVIYCLALYCDYRRYYLSFSQLFSFHSLHHRHISVCDVTPGKFDCLLHDQLVFNLSS